MTNTMTDPAALAREVGRLRELVLDLGEAVTRLTAEHGALRARVAELKSGADEGADAEEQGRGYMQDRRAPYLGGAS